MKNICVNITGKLPQGVVELYADINHHTKALGMDFLVVGAMARDMVLVHGYGSSIERGTRDVDFAVNVPSWEDFNALRDNLLKAGYQNHPNKLHRLTHTDEKGLPWEIDIIPFGEIADKNANIHWPPKQDIVMTVLGFAEAADHALQVQVSEHPKVIIPVASPAGMALLKLVAWLDRDTELKSKDATDFEYLIQSYSKIPEIKGAIYDEGQMHAQGWIETLASAMKLGQDAGRIASSETWAFLNNELFQQPAKKEQLARGMQGQFGKPLDRCIKILETFSEGF